MIDWNVVVTTRDDGFECSEEELEDFGFVSRTDYYNVLVMRVEDIAAFLEEFSDRTLLIPDLMDRCVSRVAPAEHAFGFASAEEFQDRAEDAARAIAPDLAASDFYVRVHRRGFRESLSSSEAERSIAGAIFDRLEEEDRTAEVDFDDPDAVVAVEIVGPRAGLSVWKRSDLDAYPFLAPG